MAELWENLIPLLLVGLLFSYRLKGTLSSKSPSMTRNSQVMASECKIRHVPIVFNRITTNSFKEQSIHKLRVSAALTHWRTRTAHSKNHCWTRYWSQLNHLLKRIKIGRYTGAALNERLDTGVLSLPCWVPRSCLRVENGRRRLLVKVFSLSEVLHSLIVVAK